MLKRIIEEINNEQYEYVDEMPFQSSVGCHVRHVLDHYDMFFAGQATGLINYDARLRDKQIEVNRQHAISIIQDIIAKFDDMDIVDRPVDVVMDIQRESGTEPQLQASSVGRELAFLHSHTAHHFAMLALIFRAQGLEIDMDDFGFAPATIRHQRALQCAL